MFVLFLLRGTLSQIYDNELKFDHKLVMTFDESSGKIAPEYCEKPRYVLEHLSGEQGVDESVKYRIVLHCNLSETNDEIAGVLV